MIDERKLIAKLEKWAKESKEASGLKEPALLQKVMDEVKSMAVNEEIKARIEREDVSDRWIPVTKKLPEETYVLVSFENSSLPDIGRYKTDEEGGAFHPSNIEGSYIGCGLIVNAWMPLPESYKEAAE